MNGSRPGRSGACRVLVVDSNEELARALCYAIDTEPDLVSVGYCCSGKEALLKACASAADIMLLDFNLSDRNALAVLDEAKETAATVGIIVFTGHALPELAHEARAHGAAGFVVKGIAFDELVVEIMRIFVERAATIAGRRLILPAQ